MLKREPPMLFRQLGVSRALVVIGERLVGRGVAGILHQCAFEPAQAFVFQAVAQEKQTSFAAQGRVMRLSRDVPAQLRHVGQIALDLLMLGKYFRCFPILANAFPLRRECWSPDPR